MKLIRPGTKFCVQPFQQHLPIVAVNFKLGFSYPPQRLPQLIAAIAVAFVKQPFKATQCGRVLKQNVRTGFGQQQVGNGYLLAIGNLKRGIAVDETDTRSGQANFGAGKQMHGLLGVHGNKGRRATAVLLGARLLGTVINIDVGRVFEDQHTKFFCYIKNLSAAGITEGNPGRVMPIRHRVIEGNKITGAARRKDLRTELLRIRPFIIHIHTEDPGRLIQRTARQKPRIGRCICDEAKLFSRPLEQCTDQTDASGRANRGYQAVRIKRHTPVIAIHRGKGLPSAARSQCIGIGVGLPQKFWQGVLVVMAFKRGEVLKVAIGVVNKPARVRDFRMRVTRAKVMNRQPFCLCDRSQIRQ